MIYKPREDSYLLQKFVKKFVKNKKFLDIGSGSGIQVETAIKAKAKSVVASDINTEVIKILKEKKINVIKSNLFQNIIGKFDLIVFNPPYLPTDSREDKKSKEITSGGFKGDEIILRFLSKVKYYLTKSGKILLIISSLTPQEKINKFLQENNFKKTILEKKKFFMEELECWELEIQEK